MKPLFVPGIFAVLQSPATKNEIQTEILIKATPEKVWSLLCEFEIYPEWNPFIKSLSVKVETGNRIKVKIAPTESGEITFKPRVLKFEKKVELR